MLLFELLERVMERCPIELQKNGSLQKTLPHGGKCYSADFSHIPSQPAVLLMYFWCITKIKDYFPTPTISILHYCGALTPGQVFIPASWSSLLHRRVFRNIQSCFKMLEHIFKVFKVMLGNKRMPVPRKIGNSAKGDGQPG